MASRTKHVGLSGLYSASDAEIENGSGTPKIEIKDDFRYVKVEKIGCRQQMKQCFDR